ncbi:hypothetical protein GCM10010358_39930 [Streptomyces minutiscleroticus]|uniref:Uncharacterized protein n=1 Tax=Streptomyces minutiscleroticus TaxID=68238 RepID=A0A918NMR8_9ACTN|nr:hypothetical protein GCM10010358_39930 [Streptomyces minutiscleroticus]
MRSVSVCGHASKENRPVQAEFHRVSSGRSAHAGAAGALSVLRVGLVRREARPAWRQAAVSAGGGVTVRSWAPILSVPVFVKRLVGGPGLARRRGSGVVFDMRTGGFPPSCV